MPLPSNLTSGPLQYLSERRSRPVAIIASGPSLKEIDPTLIPEEALRFRMNMFFTEPTPVFGNRVDGLFWANDVDVFYEILLKTFEDGLYDYKTFFTPNPIAPEKQSSRTMTDKCRQVLHPRYDHWMIIAHAPRVVHNMLQRPLPTQAFQVLAASLVMGFRELHLIGVDMYSDPKQRYAHDYGDKIKSRMKEKDITPGYENAAHAQWRDLAFLQHLRTCYPDARIYNASSVSPLRDHLPDSPLLKGEALTVNPDVQPEITAGETPAFKADAKPSLINHEAEAMRWKAESAALRASTSYRLGNALAKPFYFLKNPASIKINKKPAPALSQNDPEPTRKQAAPTIQISKTEGSSNKATLTTTSSAEPAPAYDGLDVLAICHETTSMTGGYRPIKSYIEKTKALGRNNKIIDLTACDPSRKKPIKWEERRTTIINSIAPIQWKSVRDLLKSKPENTWLYLHEMGWIFDIIKNDQPDFYRQIEEAVNAFPVLCVSEVQRDFIEKTFTPPLTQIVYNVAENGNTNPQKIGKKLEQEQPIVLMVGTIQHRKGPDLFCAVADLAKKEGLPYRFQWVGHQTSPDLELSDNVEWLGNKSPEQLKDIYRNVCRFFLTSYDDPFPLSCIEALSFGVPVVSYRNSGVCEVIDGMPGCAVFDDRDPKHVLSILKCAISEKPEPMRLFFHARPYTDSANFVDVLDHAIGLT